MRTAAEMQSSEPQINRSMQPLPCLLRKVFQVCNGRSDPRHHVDRNCGLGYLDADVAQLPMDLGSVPQRVLKAHSSDQVAHLLGDPRSATRRTRLPSTVSGKTPAMPMQDGLGPNDGYGAEYAKGSDDTAK
jgi:hypothetical protein